MIQLRAQTEGMVDRSRMVPGNGFVSSSKPFFFEEGALASPGALTIDEDGEMNTYYLPGATIIDDGMTVKYLPPYRFYLMNSPTTDYSNASNFAKLNLIGKTFTVDIDFKSDGPACGCNVNFYMVDGPVSDAGKDGDYYCDAQCFPDMGCCTEWDMNEGNKMVQQITNHACTNDYSDHPDWACNKWGDPEVKTHPSDFSPGAGHTIDSNQKYEFAQKYEMQGSDLVITTTMTQNDRDVVLRMGPGNSQLNAMGKVMEKGMVFVTGYWFAPDMNWMDGDECGSGEEHCDMNPAYIGNWRITSNGNSPPTPPQPSPTPTPSPSPSPSPQPSGSRCCWGGPGVGCSEPGNWCELSAANCGTCGGQWGR